MPVDVSRSKMLSSALRAFCKKKREEKKEFANVTDDGMHIMGKTDMLNNRKLFIMVLTQRLTTIHTHFTAYGQVRVAT